MNGHTAQEQPRPLQAVREEQAAVMPAGTLPNEANVFMLHPSGVKVHFKLLSLDAGKLLKNVDTLISSRIDAGYRPDEMGRSPGNGHGAAPAAQDGAGAQERAGKASKYKGPVHTACPQCGGAIYDNREKKDTTPSWRGPWFKCRDEDDCGWTVFKNDGSAGR